MLVLCRTMIVFSLIASACAPDQGSRGQNLFRDDEGNPNRRRKATNDEILSVVYMGGCTGHLLSKKYMMTAAHCQPSVSQQYQSGSNVIKQLGHDIEVRSIAEIDAELDYAIVEIHWFNLEPQDQKITAAVATVPTDVKTSLELNAGDDIYTVGFPADKTREWGVTYAAGQLKGYAPQNGALYYDMGTINGNSGGAVWRKNDGMLVALTNQGSAMLNQPGWNQRDRNDRDAWNWGVAMWNVYKRSKIMQDIFPNGKNRFLPAATPSTPGQPASDSSLFLALVADQGGAANAQIMLLSASPKADKVIFCVGQTNAAACSESAAGALIHKSVTSLGSRNVFTAGAPSVLARGTKVAAVAMSAGQRLAAGVLNID